ncbi:hypothetical protein [Desertivirga arenae]|uniref:hypothetical protein n=1 Tax=Desertivirga arenae TaxID=2810309 RepID=UPI001A967909|nr:hypothetical protein [Pedobacter sp. SYSU D00823]
MKEGKVRFWVLCYFLLLSVITVAQVSKPLIGVVFRKGTSVRIYNATVYNLNKGISVSTDHFGLFTIMSSIGDTLSIEAEGYIGQKVGVRNYSDVMVYLVGTNVLAEVKVTGISPKQNLKEVEEEFRKKGIYYKGKPPLALLLPFGGSPLTFFHELLSKDGKRARRFHKYAEAELEYYEIARRFNDNTIKKTVNIKEEELEEFKKLYWPSADLVKGWNDFDLFNYIKRSYKDFTENKPKSTS